MEQKINRSPDLNRIREETKTAIEEIIAAGKLQTGEIFVLGCSSSEVLGETIGSCTNTEVAGAIYQAATEVLAPKGVYLAAQCCEHLNRALVVTRECAKRYRLEIVNAIPQPEHAGGALATVAYRELEDAVVVEDLRASASAGIDIGGTLIGMHLQPVAVPLRISVSRIGAAHVICARRRAKYIGGARTVYDDALT